MTADTDSLLIIAEAAQGYEGDAGLARALVRAAAGAGADALKLQLVYADELCTGDYKHHALFRSLEMADEIWLELANYAQAQKIALMLDVFGPRSLALAIRLGAAAVKIHAGQHKAGNVNLQSPIADPIDHTQDGPAARTDQPCFRDCDKVFYLVRFTGQQSAVKT